jgi:hypothetical protein
LIEIFWRTLRENFSTPHLPLLDLAIRINRTLPEIFQADID